MTRKKFVKLLMSHGFQRNKANDMACTVRHNGIDYETFYEYASGSPVYVLSLLSYIS